MSNTRMLNGRRIRDTEGNTGVVVQADGVRALVDWDDTARSGGWLHSSAIAAWCDLRGEWRDLPMTA